MLEIIEKSVVQQLPTVMQRCKSLQKRSMR